MIDVIYKVRNVYKLFNYNLELLICLLCSKFSLFDGAKRTSQLCLDGLAVPVCLMVTFEWLIRSLWNLYCHGSFWKSKVVFGVQMGCFGGVKKVSALDETWNRFIGYTRAESQREQIFLHWIKCNIAEFSLRLHNWAESTNIINGLWAKTFS